MKRRQDYTFSRVPRADIPRARFMRSHGYKTTFDAGWLIPFYVDEALPGDTFRCKVTMFARLGTALVPIMDNLYLETFFFSVPNRLLWSNWQRFCGEEPNPGDSTDFLVPEVESGATGFAADSIFDYMGVPPLKDSLKVSALWPRAYNLIWNEWFRDENLQTRAVQNVDDGPDAEAEFPLRKRGKRHDYFTSALPWPQKGTATEVPLGGFANVLRDDAAATPHFLSDAVDRTLVQGVSGTNTMVGVTGAAAAAGTPMTWGTEVGLQADLSTGQGLTINAMREAFQIQKFLERDARGGTRYVELLKSHFGVVSPDFRLQRPEFLGGGSSPVILTPIAAQGAAAGYSIGEYAAAGTVQASGHGFFKSFVEHCTIIGLMMVRADLTYQQGLQRMWSRRTRYDFYWPVLSHLGEQEVLNKEIFAQGPTVLDAGLVVDDQVFGYQERWAEYRYYPSLLTSRLRSDAASSLQVWHLAQDFASLPTLSAAFIEEDVPVDRVIAVPSEPHFVFDAYFEIEAARPMPLYSVPGLIDHF